MGLERELAAGPWEHTHHQDEIHAKSKTEERKETQGRHAERIHAVNTTAQILTRLRRLLARSASRLPEPNFRSGPGGRGVDANENFLRRTCHLYSADVPHKRESTPVSAVSAGSAVSAVSIVPAISAVSAVPAIEAVPAVMACRVLPPWLGMSSDGAPIFLTSSCPFVLRPFLSSFFLLEPKLPTHLISFARGGHFKAVPPTPF